jgi:hypothetical protein
MEEEFCTASEREMSRILAQAGQESDELGSMLDQLQTLVQNQQVQADSVVQVLTASQTRAADRSPAQPREELPTANLLQLPAVDESHVRLVPPEGEESDCEEVEEEDRARERLRGDPDEIISERVDDIEVDEPSPVLIVANDALRRPLSAMAAGGDIGRLRGGGTDSTPLTEQETGARGRTCLTLDDLRQLT